MSPPAHFFILCSIVCAFLATFVHSHGFALPEERKGTSNKSSVSALLVFGDSTVDAGNNQFYPTIARGNFPPYGIDYPQRVPTGRFCNGRLFTDFVASYLGIKDAVPAYLNPSLSLDDLVTGVSFASAGSGFDPHTPPILGVIPMSKQLEYFREYRCRLEESIGKERTQEIIEKAVVLVSSSSNDFLFKFAIPSLLKPTPDDISAYQQFIVDQCKQFIQDLIAQGARKIAIVSAAPIGCLPIVLTVDTRPIKHPKEKRSCIEPLSLIAKGYNKLLEAELNAMNSRFMTNNGTIVVYVDIYSPLVDCITNPEKYGFEVVDRGCCGTGLLEISFLCTHLSPICSDRSKYVFFDSVHPTEATYKLVANAVQPVIDSIVLHQ